MWHGLKAEGLSLQTQPSHRYLDVRQCCRTFQSVASGPCDWLLVLAMRDVAWLESGGFKPPDPTLSLVPGREVTM
jgi:hypothetical protein